MQQLAEGVLRACAPLPVTVITESQTVALFAESAGADVLLTATLGLNQVVSEAATYLRNQCDQLIIVHGDLQQPIGLGAWDPNADVTVVTDRHGSGTNVLAIPSDVDFSFQYGPRSAYLHELEASRLGLSCDIVRNSPWQFDIDEPQDLIT
jgi:2-phospho-L-lactate guanylyltransferase (CobY/MobA/RfbA family)